MTAGCPLCGHKSLSEIGELPSKYIDDPAALHIFCVRHRAAIVRDVRWNPQDDSAVDLDADIAKYVASYLSTLAKRARAGKPIVECEALCSAYYSTQNVCSHWAINVWQERFLCHHHYRIAKSGQLVEYYGERASPLNPLTHAKRLLNQWLMEAKSNDQKN